MEAQSQGTEVVKRTRASTPRTRGGCLTCRIRHVKCDEQRPSCRRCTTTGRHCPGYTTLQPRTTTTNTTTSSPASLLPITTYALPFRVPGGRTERRLLHYFCVAGHSDLAGWVSSDFWARVVLQYSCREPVVRQAVIALSSVHLEIASERGQGRGGGGRRGESEESLRLYQGALKQLRKLLGRERVERVVVLICCLVLYAFEGARGEGEAALRHLENGLGILRGSREVDSSSLGGGDVERRVAELAEILSRLWLQGVKYDVSRPLPPLPNLGAVPQIPVGGAFNSLEDAQLALAQLESHVHFHIMGNLRYKYAAPQHLPEGCVEAKQILIARYYHWTTALSAYLDGQAGKRKEEIERTRRGAKLLQLLHHTNLMYLMFKIPRDPSVYHGPLADRVLDLAESLLDDEDSLHGHGYAAQSDSMGKHRYSSEMGLITPLFTLAIRTTDPRIWTRAEALMARVGDRREGLHDARLFLRILQQAIPQKERLEEECVIIEIESTDPTNISVCDWAMKHLGRRSSRPSLYPLDEDGQRILTGKTHATILYF